MPNIEICGFGPLAANQIRSKIEKAMRTLGLQADAVTSIVPMDVRSCDGKRTKKPYLRICSTKKAEIKKVIGALKKAKIREDVVCLLSDRFIPATEMRPRKRKSYSKRRKSKRHIYFGGKSGKKLCWCGKNGRGY